MRRAVLELASVRPVWSIPDESTAAIRVAFGRGWDVVSVATPGSSDGDGGGGSADAIRAAVGAEVYMGWGVAAPVVRAGGSTLKWVHTAAAGVGGSLTPDLAASGATFTNSSAVHAEPIADWTIAAIGYCARGFHAAVRAQTHGAWAKDAFTDGSVHVREYAQLRVGLVGLGGIGRAIARRCAALGMVVRAVRRRPELPRPDGIVWVGNQGEVARLASESDVLVIAAPRTAQTERIVDAAVLEALPEGAHVLNVARGELLDEEALLTQLDSGRLGGCALDVFATEPLPAGHPFWTHPRVLVTPHVSAVSSLFWERETTLILDNIQRYLAGMELQNIVDLESGY